MIYAEFFLHPEKPITTTVDATARCYFDRATAPERLHVEDADEKAFILEDLKALKKFAIDYMHPEVPVVTTDATARARNFFSRLSGSERESVEESEERIRVLEDAIMLKKFAVDYMHPELPVVTTDPTACARNYFSRPSAPEQESVEEADARVRIFDDLMQLNRLAVDYAHPELPAVTTDATTCGRNYFTRASAPEQESLQDTEERKRILEDAMHLKEFAVDYMHPELPVIRTDAMATGRNYFTRASAPEQMSLKDVGERTRILEDAMQLKKLSVDYMHPELPVITADATSTGRNYFMRASAPEQDLYEEASERALILEDAMMLKKLAVDYMHPELPVVTTDPTACARNYFSRPSAPVQESVEEAEERALIMEETMQLKSLAVDYMHPERPVVTTDFTTFGRNYFSRFSAPEQESVEDAEEHVRILEDVMQLKKLAVDYMHPEQALVATCCGRNFFTRASAPEQESIEEAEERALVLAEAIQLQKLAVDYLHPERPVVTSDSTATGRNYFDRPSARGHAQMIHTFPPHEDDIYHDDSDNHCDHFGMEEELDHFADMRQHLRVPSPPPGAKDFLEEGSNLSRSPSSVMLFTGESIYD
jgi:hypothetical protein